MTLATLMVRPASWTRTTSLARQTSGLRGTELPGLTPSVSSNSCRTCPPRCQQWGTERAVLPGTLPLPWALHRYLLGTPWWRHHCRRALWTPWAAPLPGAQLKKAVTSLLLQRKNGQCSQDAVLGRLCSQAPRLTWLPPRVVRLTILFSSLPS